MAGALTLALPTYLQYTPEIILIAGVLVAAWFGGLGPGLLASALAILFTGYTLVAQAEAVSLRNWSGALGLLVFAVVLVTVLVEEALRARIPTLIIDVKGDLPNLLLSFPNFAPEPLVPWLEPGDDAASAEDKLAHARKFAEERRASLAEWSLGEPELARYCAGTNIRVITPGVAAGELLHVLSPLERRSPLWSTDPDSARQSLSAAVSLVHEAEHHVELPRLETERSGQRLHDLR